MNYLPRERHCNSPVLRAIFSMCQIVFALEIFFFGKPSLDFLFVFVQSYKIQHTLGEKNITVL